MRSSGGECLVSADPAGQNQRHMAVISSTPTWFAVQVRGGREALGAQHLEARGYEVFVPWYVEQRRWSDRIRRITRALFEGYVFCRLSSPVLATIVTTPGVIRIVGNSDGPIAVPLDEIEALQRIVATQLSVQPWPFLRTGQRVRIQDGPLRGTEGLVLTIKNQHCLVVSVSVLQRSVAVEIQSDWIEVDSPPALDWRADAHRRELECHAAARLIDLRRGT